MQRRAAPLVLASLAFLLTACGTTAGGDPDRVDVVAAVYPLQFVAERVGGDAVVVRGLTRPGAEPHDLELTPSQVAQVADAEVVVYLSGFQPAVDEAVAQQAGDRAFDVMSAVAPLPADAGEHRHDGGSAGGDSPDEHGGADPHLWLDPTRLADVADALAARLAAADPSRGGEFRSRAAALRAELDTLDKEYADGLADCARHELVVSHTAFGYLAARYDLEQIGIAGLAPEAEPSPGRLAAVAEEVREHGATTIFVEPLVSPKHAETIAREVGVDTAVLNPLEGLPAGSGDDYFSVMRENLSTLRTGLGCR